MSEYVAFFLLLFKLSCQYFLHIDGGTAVGTFILNPFLLCRSFVKMVFAPQVH